MMFSAWTSTFSWSSPKAFAVPAAEIVWLERRASATRWMLSRSEGMTELLRDGLLVVGRRDSRVL